MRTLLVHPSGLMYSEIFLRLEPLGVERVAAAVRAAGHEVRLLDLQIFSHRDLYEEIRRFEPEAVGFGLNYLANVPEVIDLAKRIKRLSPRCFVFAGGHSVSFIADHVIKQADGALDAVLRGEGEVATPLLLAAAQDGGLTEVPGVVTGDGACHEPPLLLSSLDEPRPARELTRCRHKYFIGVLDPAASIEFTRGCPWDCSFCSAWTLRTSPDENIKALELARGMGLTVAVNLIVDPRWGTPGSSVSYANGRCRCRRSSTSRS